MTVAIIKKKIIIIDVMHEYGIMELEVDVNELLIKINYAHYIIIIKKIMDH